MGNIFKKIGNVLKKYDDDLVSGAAIRDDLGRVISKTYGRGVYYTKEEIDTMFEGLERPVQSDWTQLNENDLSFIKHKPTLFDGDYNNLRNKPTIPSIEGLAKESDLSDVAFSGNYSDLKNIPPAVEQVQSNWTETNTTSKAYIKNKPTIKDPVQSDWNETNVNSLAYIKNKPTIPEELDQVQSDWEEETTTEKSYIKNKPNLNTKIDTIELNNSTYTTENGIVKLGNIYGDEYSSIGDGSGNISSGFNGFVRLFRCRLQKGTGGGSSPIGKFTAIGYFFGPSDNDVGQLFINISGDYKESISTPWVHGNNVRNFTIKLLSNSEGALSKDDFILAIDKSNSNFDKIDNIVIAELWVRLPVSKSSFKWYFSNASVIGNSVTNSYYYDGGANAENINTYIDERETRKLMVASNSSIGNEEVKPANNVYKTYIDIPITITKDEDLVLKYPIRNQNGECFPLRPTNRREIKSQCGVPFPVAVERNVSGNRVVTKANLTNYANLVDEDNKSRYPNKQIGDSTYALNSNVTVLAPYFATGVFNNIEYYLIACD